MVAKTQYAAQVAATDQGVRWDDARIFLAIMRDKSLNAAARRLRLDTSTLSRRLVAFEAQLGATLFERTKKGLLPTRLAVQMLPAAEAAEAAHQRLLRAASGVETRVEGVVRISVAPGMADVFVASRLSKLRARHPALRFEIDASMRVIDLSSFEADLALRLLPPSGADLVTTKLLSARSVPACSRALDKQLGKVRRLDQVPWIAWDRDLSSFAPSLWLSRYAKGADIVLRTSHMASQLVAAQQGLGVLLLPEPYLQTHDLVPLRTSAALAPALQRLPKDSVWLVTHRALRDVPRVAAVWTFLAEELRTLRGGSAG